MTSTPLYAPLQYQDSIRLLQIKPGNDEHGIELVLKPFRLIPAIKFTALSYVWGMPTPERSLSCNGHRISITPNLHGALLQLLQQGFDGLLWVDALCINQQNDEEKSVQVAMMREIFSQAAKVIFWLGEQQEFDEGGARLMRAFFKKHPEPLLPHYLRDLRTKTLGELGVPYLHQEWLGWASLLNRPWFGRVWIVQELFNAKESVFMSGAVEIPTKVLFHCAAITDYCPDIIATFMVHVNDTFLADKLIKILMIHYVTQPSAHLIGKEDISIDDLWKRSRLMEATDARDRVFALLSLQTTLSMDMVDYRKNIVEVYTEVAEKALTLPTSSETSSQLGQNSSCKETQRSSRFLACKEYSSGDSGLPSWVPDWRPSSINFSPLTDVYEGTSTFEYPYQDAIIDKKTMSISGIVVDRPWVVVDFFPYAEDVWSTIRGRGRASRECFTQLLKDILNWEYMCYMLARSKNAAMPRHQLLATFCRTMAFDALPARSFTTNAEYIGGFQAHRKELARRLSEGDVHSVVFEGYESSDRRYIDYENRFITFSPGRKFCVTEAGRLAWIPSVAKPDDEICFLAGCAVPFVIRRAGESWQLLGDCYLDGLMSLGSPVFGSLPQVFRFI